uniref:Uncharacterized protein n=1 Tax=Anopheles atroparvus TaxID=41427 RepID=A0A182IJH9_ANOAO
MEVVDADIGVSAGTTRQPDRANSAGPESASGRGRFDPRPVVEHICVHPGQTGPPAAPTEANDSIKRTVAHQWTPGVTLARVDIALEATGTERTPRYVYDRTNGAITAFQVHYGHVHPLQAYRRRASASLSSATPTEDDTLLPAFLGRPMRQWHRVDIVLVNERPTRGEQANIGAKCFRVPVWMGQIAECVAQLHRCGSIVPIEYASHYANVGRLGREAVRCGENEPFTNQRSPAEQPCAKPVSALVGQIAQRHVKRGVSGASVPPTDDPPVGAFVTVQSFLPPPLALHRPVKACNRECNGATRASTGSQFAGSSANQSWLGMVSLSRGTSFLFGCWLLVVVLGVLIRPAVGQTTPTTCAPSTRNTRSVLRLAGLRGILPQGRPEIYNILARRPLPSFAGVPVTSGPVEGEQKWQAIPEKRLESKLSEALHRALRLTQ